MLYEENVFYMNYTNCRSSSDILYFFGLNIKFLLNWTSIFKIRLVIEDAVMVSDWLSPFLKIFLDWMLFFEYLFGNTGFITSYRSNMDEIFFIARLDEYPGLFHVFFTFITCYFIYFELFEFTHIILFA